jgi:predicted nucleic acid-binding protein
VAWLLDTNVLSELRRPRPEPRVVEFMSRRAAVDLYISVVTLSEIRYGIERLPNTRQRDELHDWLTGYVRTTFFGRVLPIDEEVMLQWRVLMENGRKQGHTYSQPDLIIAATALRFRMTVATRDISDFERAKVPFLNPWLTA